MKNLLLSLFCLVLIASPITTNQTALANGHTLSASIASGINIGSSLTNNPLLSNITVSPSISNINATRSINAADKTVNSITAITSIQPNNCFNLSCGNILVSPDRDIAINTGNATVSIASGATIFVMSSTAGMIIYDLNQTKPKQVSVVVHKHKLILEPGHMLVLTRQKAKSFEELEANCHRVSYRRPEEINLPGDDMTAFAAGFSISSALTRIIPLKQLINSNEKRDQILLDKLIKTAVILGT